MTDRRTISWLISNAKLALLGLLCALAGCSTTPIDDSASPTTVAGSTTLLSAAPETQTPEAQTPEADDEDLGTADQVQEEASPGEPDASWTPLVGPNGQIRILVPPEWDRRSAVPNNAGGVILEATTDTLAFAVDGVPGIRLTTGTNLGNLLDDTSVENAGIFFGPAPNCESDLVEVPYESATLPGRRFDYTECGTNFDLTATFVVFEANGSFVGGVLEAYEGAGSPSIETLIANIEIGDFAPAAADQTDTSAPEGMIRITDDSGRLSTVIPADWDFDTRPGAAGDPFLGAVSAVDGSTFGSVQLGISDGVSWRETRGEHLRAVETFELAEECEEVSAPEEISTDFIPYGFVTEASGCGESGEIEFVLMFGVDLTGTEGYLLVVDSGPGQEFTGQTALTYLRIS